MNNFNGIITIGDVFSKFNNSNQNRLLINTVTIRVNSLIRHWSEELPKNITRARIKCSLLCIICNFDAFYAKKEQILLQTARNMRDFKGNNYFSGFYSS